MYWRVYTVKHNNISTRTRPRKVYQLMCVYVCVRAFNVFSDVVIEWSGADSEDEIKKNDNEPWWLYTAYCSEEPDRRDVVIIIVSSNKTDTRRLKWNLTIRRDARDFRFWNISVSLFCGFSFALAPACIKSAITLPLLLRIRCARNQFVDK